MIIRKGHPWGLIWVKLTCFPVLWIVNKILANRAFRPLRYKFKKVLFFDRFSSFARKHFYSEMGKGTHGGNIRLYRVGPGTICLPVDDARTPLAPLEWNLSREYLDIVYPAENPKYYRFLMAEGPYELDKNVVLAKGDYVVDAGASSGGVLLLSSQSGWERWTCLCYRTS